MKIPKPPSIAENLLKKALEERGIKQKEEIKNKAVKKIKDKRKST